MSLYRAGKPKATAAELNAFLFNMNRHNPNFNFYSGSQFSRAEKSIYLTTKRSSTTANQAFLFVNMQKRENYWNLPYPFGIANVPVADIIDIDECSIFLEQINRTCGKGMQGDRVTEQGAYSKTAKVNLMMAICGDPAMPERWHEMWEEGGTTIDRFVDFLERVINDLEAIAPNRTFYFTMDNLSSHTSARVSNLVIGRGHRLIFRAPYYPIDGAIEYVFNTLQASLRLKMYQIDTREDLMLNIEQSIANIAIFTPYFCHVGFVL